MEKVVMRQFLDGLRELEAKRIDFRRRVRDASKARLHTQACPIGGLATGAAASASGNPCWCGASAEKRRREEGQI